MPQYVLPSMPPRRHALAGVSGRRTPAGAAVAELCMVVAVAALLAKKIIEMLLFLSWVTCFIHLLLEMQINI